MPPNCIIADVPGSEWQADGRRGQRLAGAEKPQITEASRQRDCNGSGNYRVVNRGVVGAGGNLTQRGRAADIHTSLSVRLMARTDLYLFE